MVHVDALRARPVTPLGLNGRQNVSFTEWRTRARSAVLDAVERFLAEDCESALKGAHVDVAPSILRDSISGGNCLRSTFVLLGSLCGTPAIDDACVRVAASFELLHAFALLQDDVMDESSVRRGRPAAVLLGDLCLLWAEQMLRQSGVSDAALSRAWPRYDAMRTELAVGQFADLVNDAGGSPDLDTVLDVARRKSGNYTVRRPLEIGAAMAGCPQQVLDGLGAFGDAVGEAFQLRDDLLGVFGSPQVTGKPVGGDLLDRKATSVVVAAHELADESVRHQLTELTHRHELDEAEVYRWRSLIAGTGAVHRIESMISDRLIRAQNRLHEIHVDHAVRNALMSMATVCTARAA